MPLYLVVIFETLLEMKLVVKISPALSIAKPYGYEPVDPRMVDVPVGVIFVTLFALVLAV